HAKTTRYTAGCAGPGSRSIWRNDDRRTRVVEPAAGHPSRYVPVRASTGPIVLGVVGPSDGVDRSGSVRDQCVHVGAVELLPAREERQLDHEEGADDL